MKFLVSYLKALLLRIGRFRPEGRVATWVSGAGAGMGVAGLGATQLLSLLGFTAVTHSSGAAILTGAGGYVAGTYGIAAVLMLITAPVAIFVYLICLMVGL